MIIREPYVFSESYMPTEIFHRERQIKDISFSINMVLKGYSSIMLVYGPQGTGKTTVVKYLVERLKNESNGIISYIDGMLNQTPLSLISKVCNDAGVLLPSRGFSIDDALNKLLKIKKPVILFIDESDAVDSSIIYKLSKSIVSRKGGFLGLVTNVPEFFNFNDFRMPGISIEKVEFDYYKPEELRDIISERAKLGLFPNTYSKDVLGAIVGYGLNKGNARIAIKLLFLSAKEAEKRDGNFITIEDVEKAKEKLVSIVKERMLNKLSYEERLIVDYLIKKGRARSEDFYPLLNKSKRTVREILKRLAKKGYIIYNDKSTRHGRIREYRLNYKI